MTVVFLICSMAEPGPDTSGPDQAKGRCLKPKDTERVRNGFQASALFGICGNLAGYF